MNLPGLQFSLGEKFHETVVRNLRQPVSCPNPTFALVVAFGRCKFRLDPCSVSLILQATFGGLAHHYHVSLLSDRTFKFFVSSKVVGFHLVNLRSFSCELYSLTLHLWGNGGPNWRRELAAFIAEEQRSWLPANRRQHAASPAQFDPPVRPSAFAEAVKSGNNVAHANPNGVPLSGANAIPLHASGANAIPLNSSFLNSTCMQNDQHVRHPSAVWASSSVRGASSLVRGAGEPTTKSRVDHLGNMVFGGRALAPFCQRCLSQGHHRAYCRRPIRCQTCFYWGHVAVNCRNTGTVNLQEKQRPDNSNLVAANTNLPSSNRSHRGWFNAALAGPSASSPPVFKSFAELARALLPIDKRAATETVPESSEKGDAEPNTVFTRCDPLLLSLAPSHPTAQNHSAQENPHLLPQLPHLRPPAAAIPGSPPPMAFQRADPRPFVPASFQWVDIPNREFMCRAVAPTTPPPVNEDLAIAVFDPLPGNVLNFGAVRNTIRQFLIEKRINPKTISPSHLGQAYVRFYHAYERDNMVRNSPMVCGNMHISFLKHNEARNWRRVFFNDDCWVMMLGFPEDYRTERHIQNAVSGFGKLLLWEESNTFPGRILARVRVTNVQGVPQFIAYSDSRDLNGESWTIQCEVVQQVQLGDEPPEEDPLPDELELEDIVPYDFFGLGQPVIQQNQNGQEQDQNQNQGNQQHNDHQNDQQQNLNLQLGLNGLNEQHQQNNPWEPWPAWPVGPQLQAQQPAQQVQDLNAIPHQVMQIIPDLNVQVDPMEVIINPVPPPHIQNQDDDLMEVVEEHIPQPQQQPFGDQVQQQAPPPINNGNDNAGNNDFDNAEFANAFPIPPIEDIIGEEIPPEQLLENEGDNPNMEIQAQILENQVNGFPNPHMEDLQLPANPVQAEPPALEQPLEQNMEQNLDPLIQPGMQIIQNQEQELLFNNQHFQIGMALVHDNQWDLVNSSILQKKNQIERPRVWESLTPQGNCSSFVVQIPSNWAPFLNAMLLSTENFEWAKNFLLSGAARFMDNNSGNTSITVPLTCPINPHSDKTTSITDISNTQERQDEEKMQNKVSSPNSGENRKRKAAKKQTPIVENQVRRSERVRLANNGFKNSGCSDRKCTTCTPPTLSTKVIRNLGTQFCSLTDDDLKEEDLMRGAGTKEPVGKKRGKAATQDASD